MVLVPIDDPLMPVDDRLACQSAHCTSHLATTQPVAWPKAFVPLHTLKDKLQLPHNTLLRIDADSMAERFMFWFAPHQKQAVHILTSLENDPWPPWLGMGQAGGQGSSLRDVSMGTACS